MAQLTFSERVSDWVCRI